MEEYSLWLALARVLRNRVSLCRPLLEKIPEPEAIFSSSIEELCLVEGITPNVAREIKSFDYSGEEIKDEIRKMKAHGVTLITMNSPYYPERLKTIYDPPPCLYVKGNICTDDARAIAIVGTRRPTVYGRKVAEMLAKELSLMGFTIVSGMARGIDSFAHRASLKAGGRSIGVSGCGIDVVYPPENEYLWTHIAAQGAVLTEFPMGTIPDKRNFPQRNRIISGLSLGTVVVEAAEKSGSLITARFALEQGHEVFAVPGNIDSPVSKGTNRLIKQGAKLVEDANDIIEEFDQLLTKELKRGIKNSSVDENDLSDEERYIFGLLTMQPRHIDEIITESGLESRRVLQILLDLEIREFIEQMNVNFYVRVNLWQNRLS